MTTAVDTNVLLDVFANDPTHGDSSSERLKEAYNRGQLVICDVVFAELAPHFPEQSALIDTLSSLKIDLHFGDAESVYLAGRRWALYRKAGGPRKRIISDFLIGAHALRHSDCLLTRDRGFYTTYFPDLELEP
jgi:predicted nucleic acid-binding protein